MLSGSRLNDDLPTIEDQPDVFLMENGETCYTLVLFFIEAVRIAVDTIERSSLSWSISALTLSSRVPLIVVVITLLVLDPSVLELVDVEKLFFLITSLVPQ